MAEKPILFNLEMVKAILEGRKTQTRRVCKITVNGGEKVDHAACAFVEYPARNFKGQCANFCDADGHYKGAAHASIQPGDVLWVRETWQRLFEYDKYVYRADYDDDEGLRIDRAYVAWRPSIHMPRAAARLFLRVKNVRIERLDNISPMDVKAEGVKIDEDDEFSVEASQEAMELFAFEALWDSTIKPADLPLYGWEANPWVWVYEFERVEAKLE